MKEEREEIEGDKNIKRDEKITTINRERKKRKERGAGEGERAKRATTIWRGQDIERGKRKTRERGRRTGEQMTNSNLIARRTIKGQSTHERGRKGAREDKQREEKTKADEKISCGPERT